MVGLQRLQPDPRLAVVLEAGDVAQHLADPARPLEGGLDRVIQLFQPVHELIRAHLAQGDRHQVLQLDVGGVELETRLPRQNEQLAAHILAGEILAGIRLGQAVLPRLVHQFGEGASAVILLEQPG